MAKTQKRLPRTTTRKPLRRGAESRAALDVHVLEQISAGVPLTQILETITLGIESMTEGMRASILLLEDGRRVRHGAAPSLPLEWTRWIDGREIGPAEGSCGTALWRKETVVASDIASDPRWEKYREAALRFDLRASWSAPFFGPDGEALGTFAMYYDRPRTPTVTQLGLAEHAGHLASVAVQRHRQGQAQARAAEAIREHERHLALIYDHVADVLFEIQVEEAGYRFISVNPAFLTVTGLRRDQVVGRTVQELIPEPSRSLALSKYAEAIRTRATVRWEELTSFPAGPRLGEVTVTPVFDAHDQPTLLIGSVRDLTARRQMENEVRQLQKLEAIGRLSGGIAHDFNNILAVILGVGNLLTKDVTDPEIKGQIEEIMDAGRRGATLTRQFLAFARKQVLQAQPLDLSATVRDLAAIMQRLLRADISLRLHLAEHPAKVMGDPSQIEQVLMNLVVNARDAMPEGGTLTIETAEVMREVGPAVRLAVTDTGTGMSEETRRRLFEPFFTTKEPGQGTGLGLATVYGIVKQSGGAIEVESTPGQGASFRLYFPRAAEAPTAPEHSGHRDSWGRGGGLDGLQVLLVEDEPALRSAFSRMLDRLQCRVTIAANGIDALGMVERGECAPDLLITDVVVPGLSGNELARRLTAVRPNVKILRMSGYADPEISEPESPGEFLQKPFTLPELAKGVRRALDS